MTLSTHRAVPNYGFHYGVPFEPERQKEITEELKRYFEAKNAGRFRRGRG